MERKRPSGLHGEGVCRLPAGGGPGRHLPAGDENAEGAGDFDFPGYTEYWFSAEKKGYSGTAVFTKTEPLSVSYGIGLAEVDAEGRVICGDMNVAHKMIDIKNAKANIGNAGFSYEERGKFSELLAAGFNDSFRMLYPDRTDAYSWGSYMGRAREKNVGWRIDYFLVTDELKERVEDSRILSEVTGSDHCPVELILK